MSFKDLRKRVFEIIEVADEDDKASHIYDIFMMVIIIISLVPLAFKQTNIIFNVIDKIACVIFIIDYILRWITADKKVSKGAISFFIYPFYPMAIIDLICVLPSLSIINSGFRILKVLRLLRTLRVLRIFKAVRYSKSITLVLGVFRKEKKPLLTVFGLALIYTIISALVIFNVEPDSFNTFFDAFYWAVVSLTTMGYGDIYPVTTIGRIVTMISSVFGIAIIALPSGIITAGFMEMLKENSNKINKNSFEKQETNENDN